MPREYKDLGVIIKTQDYKDFDKIITICTKSKGIVTSIARGVRRSVSKRSPHIDLLNLITFQISEGNSKFLGEVVCNSSFPGIREDLKKISIAMSFMEIINSLVPEEAADEELFLSLNNFLKKINTSTSKEEIDKTSSAFARYLLRHLGYPENSPHQTTFSSYFEYLMNKRIIGKEIV